MPVPSSIADLSTSPASNSPAGSETPSSTDDYLRAHAAFIKQLAEGNASWCGTAGGTANALTLTPSPAITAYAAGQVFRFKAASTNTGATTIAISGLAAIALEINGAACAGGEIVANEWYEIILSSTTKAQLIGAYVDLSRAQTIKGVKTFSNKPVFAGGLGEEVKWLSKGIGEYYVVDDSITGVDIPPKDNPLFRYIKLTAGLTGSGQYNEGCLTSESVSGSAPLVLATAIVSLSGSPMSGQTVRLRNTEGRYIKPGTTPGTVANDKMQQITGLFRGYKNAGSTTTQGAFSEEASTLGMYATGSTIVGMNTSFDSANSPGARTGTSTDVKHQQVTVYQRIL